MAAEIRKVVRIDAAGTVTVLRDFEDGSNLQSERGSTKISGTQRKPTMSKSQRRYGGARQTGESHDNSTFGWTTLVKGTTADAAMATAEAMFGDIESPTTDLFIEWRPVGTTNSVYLELRGVPTWSPVYSAPQFAGAFSFMVDIQFPVAPLVRHTPFSIAIGSTTIPNTVALGSAITGTAPALADVSLTTSGGTSPPIWALIGWTKRPGSPLASSVAPWGFIEAETGTSLATWASAADANYRGGNGLKATTSGAGSASALYPVDPSVMTADAFSRGEVTVEVWGRIELASTVVSPRMILSLQPFAGLTFGAEQFSSEFGSVGKAIVLPSSGTRFRPIRLGTLNMPVDTLTPLKWNLKVAASWAAGSSGQFGLDYLWLVPAKQRAVSMTGKANDASYPDFIASTAATTKTIRYDGSGRVASGAGNPGRDAGLGGSQIELPVGNVDLLIKLSSLVPDDPTLDATSEQISHTSVTGSVKVWPRSFLAGTP